MVLQTESECLSMIQRGSARVYTALTRQQNAPHTPRHWRSMRTCPTRLIKDPQINHEHSASLEMTTSIHLKVVFLRSEMKK